MLMTGFALRELVHAEASHQRILEAASRLSSADPSGPPACVFDCSYRLAGETALLGWFAVGLMVVGGSLLVWSSIRKKSL